MFLGGSVEGFFYGRDPTAWPSLVKAVRGIVSLDLGVEVWAGRGERDPEPIPEVVEKVSAICGGAPFVSVHTRHEHWTWDPTGLRREIAFCAAIGSSLLVLHRETLGLYDHSSRPDFPEIKRLVEEAREGGVQLALENSRDSFWALDRALDEIGDDPAKTNLGICIDLGHAHLSQDAGRQPVRNYLERYRGQLVHLHLHDNLGEKDDHRLLGEGSIDWPDVLRTLAAIGYQGPAVLELHSKGNLLAELETAREFLSSLG